MTRQTGCLFASTRAVLGIGFYRCLACGEDSQPTLRIVDRSLNRDGLYLCSLILPKDYPVEAIELVLFDRKKSKCGEALLATTPTPTGKKASSC